MKKLLTLLVALIGLGMSSALKANNNEAYIPPSNNNETISSGGEKQTKQYSFTLFDFFFNSETKIKSDSSQIKEKTIEDKVNLKVNSDL